MSLRRAGFATALAFTGVFTLVSAAMVVVASAALAAPTAQAEREIEALIDGLGRSGCRFERNGSWYDAATARAHLKKKYDYLRKRGLADTAELFIERAASRSSMSGKAYRVSCAGEATTESAVWFQRSLRKLRAAPTPASKPLAEPTRQPPSGSSR